MDSGTIYVREKGSLRRVNDILLAQPKAVSSSCRRTNPFVLKKEHFIFTYNEEGSLRYTTKSLFDITLLFVADNIHHVDSLIGFPEQIGDRLFAAVEEKRVFLKPDVSAQALQLFTEAYGEMVLGSLCLRNRFPLLHERIDEIRTFQSLRTLDLFGCRLGDSHELFQHLTSSSMASLIQLFIGGNSLSDAGLQRLTAPIRMMHKGLDCLQLLDLSYNPISEKALRYLKCIRKLVKLDVSGTNLKIGSGLKTTIWNELGLIHSETPLRSFDHSACKTEGWAEQVINQWETNGSQVPKQKKIDESRASALRFFGRQKFVREVLNAAPPACQSAAAQSNHVKLHFYKPDVTRPAPSATDLHEPNPTPNANKRKRQSQESTGRRPQKHSLPPALTADDIDLLNSY